MLDKTPGWCVTIGQEPVVGPSLRQLADTGLADIVATVAAAESQTRRPFYFETMIDLKNAKFGNLFGDLSFRRYTALGSVIYQIDDLTVTSPDGVLFRGMEVISDSLSHVSYWQPDSMVVSFEAGAALKFKVPLNVNRRITDAPCFIGFSPAWRNYAHWMQQSLPLIVTYVAQRRHMPALKLVVPPFLPGSFQAETLRLLGVNSDDVVEINHGEALTLATGYVMNVPDIWSVPDIVRQAAGLLGAAVPLENRARAKRVYLHRKGAVRPVTNWGAVKEVLTRYNFEVVSFEDATLVEQVATMRAASLFIGEHGAGLVNMLFCHPGTCVLELFNQACVQPAFWTVASICDHRFGYLVGSPPRSEGDIQAGWNTAYEVDIGQLEAGIKAMVEESEMGAYGIHPADSATPGDLPPVSRSLAPTTVHPTAASVSLAGSANGAETVARPLDNDLTRTLGPLAAKGLTLSLGRLSYGAPRVFFQAGMPNARLTIGSFCSIGGDCKIFVGGAGRHFHDFATTSPLTMFFRPVTGGGNRSIAVQGDLSVTVGSDVWIGEDVTIFAGVRVGHGAVVGAHSLVTRDVPPYAVVGGSPARLIRFRFSEDRIRRFLSVRWWTWSDTLINEVLEMFYDPDIDGVLDVFDRLSHQHGVYRDTLDYWT